MSETSSPPASEVTGRGAITVGPLNVEADDRDLVIRAEASVLEEVTYEGLHDWMSVGALVGQPVELSVDGQLPESGIRISKEYAARLPDEATATLAFYNEDLGAWQAVPSTISADRRTVTAQVDHLSTWTDILQGPSAAMDQFGADLKEAGHAAVDATTDGLSTVGQAIETGVVAAADEMYYFAGKAFTTRVDPPACTGDAPGWAEKIIYIEEHKNNPIHWCAGHDPDHPDVLVVKARVNRGFAYGYSTATQPSWIHNETYDQGDFDAALDVLADLDGTVAASLSDITNRGHMVGPGKEVSFGFTEEQVRALDIGEPLVVLHVPDLPGFLAGVAAQQVVKTGVDATSGWVATTMSLATCGRRVTGITDAMSLTETVVECIPEKDEVAARLLAQVLDSNGWKPPVPGVTAGKFAGKLVGKVSIGLALVGPTFTSMNYAAAKNTRSSARELTVFTSAEPSTRQVLTLKTGGKVFVHDENISALPHQNAISRLTELLGAPDETTEVGAACETHTSPGFAVRWDNFRVFIQTEDYPSGGDSRMGQVVGWELSSWFDDELDPSPTVRGVSLDSSLAATRSAFPDATEGRGDGVWGMWSHGDGVFGDTTFFFEDDSAKTPMLFMASGYGCGT